MYVSQSLGCVIGGHSLTVNYISSTWTFRGCVPPFPYLMNNYTLFVSLTHRPWIVARYDNVQAEFSALKFGPNPNPKRMENNSDKVTSFHGWNLTDYTNNCCFTIHQQNTEESWRKAAIGCKKVHYFPAKQSKINTQKWLEYNNVTIIQCYYSPNDNLWQWSWGHWIKNKGNLKSPNVKRSQRLKASRR